MKTFEPVFLKDRCVKPRKQKAFPDIGKVMRVAQKYNEHHADETKESIARVLDTRDYSDVLSVIEPK